MDSVDASVSGTDLSHWHLINVVATPYSAVVTITALDTLGVESVLLIIVNVHIQMNIVAITFAAVFESESVHFDFLK